MYGPSSRESHEALAGFLRIGLWPSSTPYSGHSKCSRPCGRALGAALNVARARGAQTWGEWSLDLAPVAINHHLYPSSGFRPRRVGGRKGTCDSCDGSRSIASRQLGHKRFCRRSQLSNVFSQRRQVVGPAYGLGVKGFGLRNPGFCPIDSLSNEWLIGLQSRDHPSTMAPYRPLSLRTEIPITHGKQLPII